MTTIERAIETIMETEGEVYLCTERDDDTRPPEKAYRVALRVPAVVSGTDPLFDPVSGDVELAGYGLTVGAAFVALLAVLDRFFA